MPHSAACFAPLAALCRRRRAPPQVVPKNSSRPVLAVPHSEQAHSGPEVRARDASAAAQHRVDALKADVATSCRTLDPCCHFTTGSSGEWWSADDAPPSYVADIPLNEKRSSDALPRGPLATIDATLTEIGPALRTLGLDIHDHPELMFNEHYAHDKLTAFFEGAGFTVTRHYTGLETAWRAEFVHGTGGRVVGICAEMDALAGIGHACGHNLIAASAAGLGIALKVALQAHDTPGRIVVIGTPAEENGGGKIILLQRGAFTGMDACVMLHPAPGAPHSAGTGTCAALQSLDVEYFGQAAHAGAAPWEGTNALDAAVLAYSSIALLRQQIRPESRIHGVIHGRNWEPNIIPDYAHLRFFVRTMTVAELTQLSERVIACFEAAALATACRVSITHDQPYYELNQNPVLMREFSEVAATRYRIATVSAPSSASTDFGNVSHAVPSLHPIFAIPTEPCGGNHTPAFEQSARAPEAHAAMLNSARALAGTAWRVFADSAFCAEVRAAFDPPAA